MTPGERPYCGEELLPHATTPDGSLAMAGRRRELAEQADVTGTPRYWNIFRQSPSGRDQKRILNRAVTCTLCSKQLGTDRALYRAYTGSMDHEYIAAHPACADQHMRDLTERLMNGVNRTLNTLSRYDLL